MPIYYVEQDDRQYRVESHSHKAAATRVAVRGGGIITVRDAHQRRKRYRLRMRGGGKLQLHIRTLSGETITLSVEYAGDKPTIGDVKKAITVLSKDPEQVQDVMEKTQYNKYEMFVSNPQGIPETDQILYFQGNELQDDKKLDPKEGITTLQIMFKRAGEFSIQIAQIGREGQEDTIQVQASDSIESVKGKIEQTDIGSDIPQEQQRLIFAGTQLQNDKTLADYTILPNATIHVVPRLLDKATTEIHIQSTDGKSLTIAVSRDSTVADVKAMIHSSPWAIPPAEQKLIFSGKQLQDDGAKLDDVQPFIQPGSTLHLVKLAAAAAAPGEAPEEAPEAAPEAAPEISVQVTVKRENDDKSDEIVMVTVPREATVGVVKDKALEALQDRIEQLEQLEKIVKIDDQEVELGKDLGDSRALTLELKAPVTAAP